jgi:hypothetical protein
LRFIANPNNTSAALTSGVSHIGDNEIYILNDSGGFDAVELGFDINSNNQTSGSLEWTESGLDIDMDKVMTILIGFQPVSSTNVSYGWHFDVNPDLIPKGIAIKLPTEEEVEAAQEAAKKDLGDPNITVEGAKEASLSTNTDVYEINKALVSSAIAVSQDIAQGGAVVLGKDMELPLNAKSLDGTNISKAENLDDLKGKYSVMKYFPNGGGVDLLARYGGALFTYDKDERTVKFTKTIVVVDRPAPSGADFTSGLCGVSLIGDYLYVFDGTADGTAEDPITLQAKPSGSGGGSGGCNAGFGLFGLLLAGLVTLKYRRA